jgi:predicted secreted protein
LVLKIFAFYVFGVDIDLLTWRGLQNTKVFDDKAKLDTDFSNNVNDIVDKIKKNNIISHDVPN